MIIDDRFNTGGNTEAPMLAALNDRAYGALRMRNSSVTVPRAGQRFFGPMILLQNERSFSDGEMFPQAFRAMGLGQLVGVTTAGGVIWTGSYTLMDGSTIRTPSELALGADGQNLENFGVQPDVVIDNTPEDWLAGRDKRLERAVEVLKQTKLAR